MPIALNGSTSGKVTVQAAAVAANNTLTLPSTGTNLLSDATLPTTTPTNGQIPIGNGTTYVPATITAGSNIAITNGAGSISIATTGLSSGFSSMQVYTSGTNTWTIPAGVTQCKVTVVGGGGGGAGANPYAGGGGGAGGCSIRYVTGLTPGGTVTATVGAAGAAGGSSGNGGAGGTSSFGAYASATGGSGGNGTTIAGGAGGAGSSGNFNISGGSGGNGAVGQDSSGLQLIFFGGLGGNTIFGGGGKAGCQGNLGGSSSTTAGATNTGGGGGGGSQSSSGAAGGSGVVIIEY